MMKQFAVALLCVVAFADEYRDTALKRAEDSVKAATEKASKDLSRPVYHFRPPANWMNDPNGPIYYRDGYYHVFYQHNPYGDMWGHMHWGHTRSQDLWRWEQLPIALWPSEDKGEAHVFSGCAAINADGVPMLFYTSVSTEEKKRPNEQWVALADKGLIKWNKHPNNPILSTSALPFEIGPDWRDPFIFNAENRTFMIIGADTKDEAIIPIFESESPQLDKWAYRGILYRQPKSKEQFFECPNFVKIADKWVLIYSPYRPLEYVVGTFDVKTVSFVPENKAVLDHGSFYASNIFSDFHGDRILLGWVRGFKEGLGWNGCMSIPRKIWVSDDGYLRQFPKFELGSEVSLETDRTAESRYKVSDTFAIVDSFALDVLPEVRIELTPIDGNAKTIRIAVNAEGVTMDDMRYPWLAKPGKGKISVRCLVDKSVLEFFALDGQVTVTKVIEHSPSGYWVHMNPVPHKGIWNIDIP